MIWFAGIVLFAAIALSAASGLVGSIGLATESEDVRATVAAGVAVVLFIVAAVVWLTGIGFIARWRGPRWTLAIGLGATVVVRLILAIAIEAPIAGGGTASVNGDGAALFAEAARVADGGLVPGDWAIGYPALLGGLMAVTGEQRWLEPTLDIVASVMIGALLFDLLRRAGGLAVAAAGIGLFAITPSQALLVPAFGPDLVYAALVLAAIWLLVAGPMSEPRLSAWHIRPGSWSTACAALAGGLLGLSHMVRPTSLALLPGFVILMLIALRSSQPRRAAAAFFLVFLAVLVPVMVDNIGRHDALSLEPTSFAGWRLAVGTDPAVGGGIAEIDPDGLESFPGETTRAHSDAAGSEALNHVLDDPMAFVELAGSKFGGAWSDDGYGAMLALGPVPAIAPGGGLLLALEIASQVVWTFVALAAAWGIARSWPLPSILVATVLVVASLAALHTVIATEGRDHAVVMPLFLIAAAVGVAGPFSADRGRAFTDRRATGGSIGARMTRDGSDGPWRAAVVGASAPEAPLCPLWSHGPRSSGPTEPSWRRADDVRRR